MSEYIIDITIENIPETAPGQPTMVTFYIKIDKNGNVDIKRKYTTVQTGFHDRHGSITDFVIINDNIPIPSYIINIIKNSFDKPNRKSSLQGINGVGQPVLNYSHYLNAIENIIILKKELAKCQSTLIDLL